MSSQRSRAAKKSRHLDSYRLFEFLALHWSSLESGDLSPNSKKLYKMIWSPCEATGVQGVGWGWLQFRGASEKKFLHLLVPFAVTRSPPST